LIGKEFGDLIWPVKCPWSVDGDDPVSGFGKRMGKVQRNRAAQRQSRGDDVDRKWWSGKASSAASAEASQSR
jgi:hypothetical protein